MVYRLSVTDFNGTPAATLPRAIENDSPGGKFIWRLLRPATFTAPVCAPNSGMSAAGASLYTATGATARCASVITVSI